MSLIAAVFNQTTKILAAVLNINSNTNAIQTDVQNGMTSQGYTIGRAPQLDNISTINTNTQPSAISSDVQTGMNNNGFNSTRGGKLDNLDTNVGSRTKQETTRAKFSSTVTSTGATTVLSVSGPGTLHGCTFNAALSGEGFAVILDGVTVASGSTTGSNTSFFSPDGSLLHTNDIQTFAPTSLQWKFSSSLVIQVGPFAANFTTTAMYSN